MQQVHVFTSAALNYIPKARMLFQSLREHHPEWKLHLALADQLPPDLDLSNEQFDTVVPLSELEIPSWRGWAFCHTIVELATAIKPFMLMHLLKQPGATKVIYLDPDIVVFSKLDDIIDALDESNIVLTPHQTIPEQALSAVIDNEICSLKHGVYNLGFVAVAANEVGQSFANWWGKRIYHFCRADIPNGLFTDQRWIDLVPAFFYGVAIMRSSRHNVATWNITTRSLTHDARGNYLVDGQPLGFYHFTGFDSGAHKVMALKNANGNESVQRLIDWYAAKTGYLSEDSLSKTTWAYGYFSNGVAIDKCQRIVYRERADLQRAFPDPFDASGYLAWWNRQGRIEFPAFFDEEHKEAALRKLSSSLSPGFVAPGEPVDWSKMCGMLLQTLTHPGLTSEIRKRGWEVLKNEGVRGIMRRFIR